MGVLIDEDNILKNQENTKKFLFRAIGRFRSESKVDKSGKNPMFKSEYNTLNDVLNALDNIQEYGLDFTQHVSLNHLVTTVMHMETGEFFESVMELNTEKETYQSFGSCLSYLRRYALMTMFGLRSNDDDGNSSLRGRATAPQTYRSAPSNNGVASSSSLIGNTDLTSLKAELAKLKTAKEINVYWLANYSAKGKTTTEAELELFTKRKEELKNE